MQPLGPNEVNSYEDYMHDSNQVSTAMMPEADAPRSPPSSSLPNFDVLPKHATVRGRPSRARKR